MIESSDTALNDCETLCITIASENPIMEKHLLSLLGTQREKYQMHHSRLSASVDIEKQSEELNDMWKI